VGSIPTGGTFESFRQKIQSMSEEDFDKALRSKGDGERLRQLGIKTKYELLDRAQEYYERYVKNQLRNSLYMIYKEYGRNSGNGFEEVLKQNIKKAIEE
jgi:hypothetical protein